MKKVITIVLLLLLIYNSVGYYIVFHIQQLKLQKEFEEYLNCGIVSEDELIVFKIPVKEYERSFSNDFNRVEGDFEKNGKFYEVVKRNIENDTLHVYCLNNARQEKLYADLSEHIENHLLDLKSTKQNKSIKPFSNLLKEYLAEKRVSIELPTSTLEPCKWRMIDYSVDNLNYISVASPPPEAV